MTLAGWTLGTEIEFEHGGTGSAIEYEAEEAIEFEQEQERGGEVELEQFWIQKSFGRFANIRVGHIVVPVGLTNAHHEPLNFFTVYRPEGENTILPCTWHQTGVSLWGHIGDFRYEAQMVAGLDAWQFSRDQWIKPGTTKPFEFETANKYGFSARIDKHHTWLATWHQRLLRTVDAQRRTSRHGDRQKQEHKRQHLPWSIRLHVQCPQLGGTWQCRLWIRERC